MFKLPKVVEISLHDLIDNDFDRILDLLSKKATDSPLLQDITYRVVGCVPPHTLYIEVDGDDSAIEAVFDTAGWPPCGMADCTNQARFTDSAGVGYCCTHMEDGVGNPCLAVQLTDFDPWWRRHEIDSRFAGLDYGVWPEGVDPGEEARPGWGLPAGPTSTNQVREPW